MLSINNTTEGYLKNVEIKGNTIQDNLGVGDLADIKSVGDKVEGPELYEIPLLCTGKNLFNGKKSSDCVWDNTLSKLASVGKNACSEILKVPKNETQIKILVDGVHIVSSNIKFFDENKNYIGEGYKSPVTIPNDAKYFVWHSPSNIMPIGSNVMVVGGSETTASYEPYVEDKLTILSPVQLEKVGDVADRIVEKDGVWGVEKNVVTEILNGTESIRAGNMDLCVNTTMFRYASKHKCISGTVISSAIVYKTNNVWGIDEETICSYAPDQFVDWRISNNKIASKDVVGMKDYLAKNNLVIKYITTTPQFIPLPHSQQVKLRTFANKTNISFLTEIEGTIKADVPKSLGATVNTHTTQIDSINTELERVKKLEESTVSTVVTESDFAVVEQTNQGYFEDLRLEGRTEVNLSSLKKCDFNTSHTFDLEGQTIKADTTYTFLADVINDINATIYLYFTDNSYISVSMKTNEKYKLIKIDSDKIVKSIGRGNTVNVIYDNIMILEGDHAQNPPNAYFEGLKSVGDGADEIVVSSSLGSGTLIEYFEQGTCNVTTGLDEVSLNRVRSNLVLIEGGCDYSLGYNKDLNQFRAIFLYDASKNLSRFLTVTQFKALSNEKYFKVVMSKIGDVPTVPSDMVDIMLNKGTTPKPYTPHKSDKKKLLYFDPQDSTWKKPILDEFSTIKKGSDGVYRYYKRGEKVVFNGSESWSLFNTTHQNDSIAFQCLNVITNAVSMSEDNFISDKFKFKDVYTNTVNEEGLMVHINIIRVSILKSKLTTQDVAGFKAWLQANNVTVVYQLAQEKVYECTNIDLITYENETNFTVKSGVLSPRTTLKVHSNISNVVSLLQKKVSLLESNMSKYMITQNRLMLDSRYSADSVTFKVDYPSMVNEKITELDYDLFNLLKANVLVGKDNYNYEKMINKIDFYQSIGMIDWDMWDEIWLIMEFQHNPPVEEIPEETPEI